MKKAQIITCLCLFLAIAGWTAFSWIDHQEWQISEWARITQDNEDLRLTIAAAELQRNIDDRITLDEAEWYINARDLANCEYGITGDFEIIVEFERGVK